MIGKMQGVVALVRCLRKFFSNQYQLIKMHAGSEAQNGLVFFLTILAQLEHIAQNSHFSFGWHRLQTPQSRLHAGRVRIIGIQQNSITAILYYLRAVIGRAIGFQGRFYFSSRHFEINTQDDGRHHVIKIVPSE